MTPEAIIEGVERDGVRLALSPSGTIKATGDEGAIGRWLPIIREHKPDIVAALRSVEHITVELAHPNAKPIFWERADGSIVGPARPEFLARAGDGQKASFWVVVQFDGQPIWINSTVLRSRKQFERQAKPKPFEWIKEPR